MAVTDTGPQPHAFDIEAETLANENYRTVAWTGRYLQVTLMTIPPGESIGLEKHPDTDQFLRVDAGTGRCVMGPDEDDLTFEREVSDGWSVQVPAGTWHDVINTGDEPLRLYAVYAPSHHAAGKIHATAQDAEADEESGNDEPPGWTVQPPVTRDDERADTLTERAAALAPALVGLNRVEAQERAGTEAGVTIRFVAENEPVTLEYRFGRITAVVRDGVVVSSSVG